MGHRAGSWESRSPLECSGTAMGERASFFLFLKGYSLYYTVTVLSIQIETTKSNKFVCETQFQNGNVPG